MMANVRRRRASTEGEAAMAPPGNQGGAGTANSLPSDERDRRAHRVVARLDERAGAGVAGEVLEHPVHDVAEPDLVLRSREPDRAAGAAVAERAGTAVGGEHAGAHEAEAEG